MKCPVKCRNCQGVYDLASVKVIDRIITGHVFKAPCCGHRADTGGGHFEYWCEHKAKNPYCSCREG